MYVRGQVLTQDLAWSCKWLSLFCYPVLGFAKKLLCELREAKALSALLNLYSEVLRGAMSVTHHVQLFVTPRTVACVHRILQARILECVAIPFSRGSSWPMDQTQVSCMVGRFFTIWATREKYPNETLVDNTSPCLALPTFTPRRMIFSCAAGQWPGTTSWS